MPTTAPDRRTSEPRERLLRIASGIFYAKGIHAVGVEEIVDSAQVTRSTFYRHFPGKDDLVVAYLQAASLAERTGLEAALASDLSPEDGVRTVARAVAGQVTNPHFRGCAFLNAAAEYPEADHPVHRAVLEHRRWFHDLVASRTALLGGTVGRTADLFVLLRDGAMAAGCLGDPHEVSEVFLAGVEQLLDAAR